MVVKCLLSILWVIYFFFWPDQKWYLHTERGLVLTQWDKNQQLIYTKQQYLTSFSTQAILKWVISCVPDSGLESMLNWDTSTKDTVVKYCDSHDNEIWVYLQYTFILVLALVIQCVYTYMPWLFQFDDFESTSVSPVIFKLLRSKWPFKMDLLSISLHAIINLNFKYIPAVWKLSIVLGMLQWYFHVSNCITIIEWQLTWDFDSHISSSTTCNTDARYST